MKITIRVPDSWAEEIDNKCRALGLTEYSRGRSSGRALLLKLLLAHALDLSPGIDYHGSISETYRRAKAAAAEPICQIDRERLLHAQLLACLTTEDIARATKVPLGRWAAAEKTGQISCGMIDLLSALTGLSVDWFHAPWPHPQKPQITGLPRWFRSLRAKYQISQRELARRSGAHVTNIGRWEKGVTLPSVANLQRIRQAFPSEPWPPDEAGGR